MSFVTKPALILAAVAAITFIPSLARAQDDPKVRVTLGAGVTAGSLDAQATGNLSVGYRFSKRFSFDVDVAGADGAADRFSMHALNLGGVQTTTMASIGNFINGGRGGAAFPNINIGGIGNIGVGGGNLSLGNGGSTTMTTVGFRYHIPSSDTRFRPYVGVGVGLSITNENFSVGILSTDPRNRNTPTTTKIVDQSTTHTGFAADGAMGASVRVFKQLSLGVDARYYLLDRGRNFGTFGGSVSYGF